MQYRGSLRLVQHIEIGIRVRFFHGLKLAIIPCNLKTLEAGIMNSTFLF